MQIGVPPSASQIFGSGSVTSIFSAGQSVSSSPAQETARVAIDAHKREINRIKGYKPVLTPAEKSRLAKIQTEIVEIERKARNGTVRQDELDDRTELLNEADEIIGKPIVDIDADETLAEYASALNTLVAPKLTPAVAKRVETLERMKADAEQRLGSNPESIAIRTQFQNLAVQIGRLTTPRPASALSVTEKRLYDDLVELINDHVGAKIELTSKEATRVAQLERAMIDLQELLPADLAQQPTPGAITRAYARLL